MKNIILLILLSVATNFASAQTALQRVEPSNWWVGMQTNDIQLLVYGNNIATLTPAIKSNSITLQKVHKVSNPNYLFLDLSITKNAKAGTVNIDFYKKKKKQHAFPFQLLDRAKGSTEIKGFDAADAIYLITPDRFANGDPSNDSVAGMKEKLNRTNKGGRHGGDIAGMNMHLDYIKDLGFTSVWLNPLLENDMEVYSYHGYSTTDYYKVDPRFGTNKSYQEFAKNIRSKDMKLIMDMIFNHCGSDHWWMNDLPMEDWINQWDTYTQTNHFKTALQDPYVSKIDKKTFTDGWFVKTMPDLNQRNPFMAKYLIQNSIWWTEFLGLAGIRMDTYPYPDMDFMAEWTREMMIEFPNLNIVGEEWFESPTIVSYWQKGKINPNGYESELTSVMDFPIQSAMSKAIKEEETWHSGWKTVYETLAHDYLYPDPMNLVVFPDNHDMSRIFSQMNNDYAKFKQAIVFVATMRGIPQYFYGTEILMNNPPGGDHGLVRSDFPGGWKGDVRNGFTNQGLTNQEIEAKGFITNLLQWRKTATAIHNGKLLHFGPKDGVYVFFRYNEEQKIMVIFNKDKTTKIKTDRFVEMLDGVKMGTDVLTGERFLLGEFIEVGADSVVVLELE